MWYGNMPPLPLQVDRESLEQWLKRWRSRESTVSRLYPSEAITLADTSNGANYHTFRDPTYQSCGPNYTLRLRIFATYLKGFKPKQAVAEPFRGVYELKIRSDGFVQGWLPSPAEQSSYSEQEVRIDLRWYFPPRAVVTAVRYDRQTYKHTDIFFDFFVMPLDEYQLHWMVAHLDQYDAQLHDHIEDLIAEWSFQDPNMDELEQREFEVAQAVMRWRLQRKLALC